MCTGRLTEEEINITVYAFVFPLKWNGFTDNNKKYKAQRNYLNNCQQRKKPSTMTSASTTFQEVLPKQGLLYSEEIPATVLCKPKLLPLKSVTLEKLERMQKEAQEKVREQEKEEQLQQKDVFGLPSNDFSM